MAVDRGYGTGSARSAANSASRRTKAASANLRKKNIQKVASKPFQKQALASVGKQAAAGFNIGGRQYLETGISPNKLLTAAKALLSAGQKSKAAAVESRYLARTGGANMDRAEVDWIQNMGEWGSLMKAGRRTRLMSEKVFPKVTNYSQAGTFNRYGDLLPKATRKARGIRRVNPQAE